MGENVVRKNLKFSKDKKEQINAANFLSKIERVQTAFVSYLTNQFLALHGVEDAESISAEDAKLLFLTLKEEYETGKVVRAKSMDMPTSVTQDDVKRYIKEYMAELLLERPDLVQANVPKKEEEEPIQEVKEIIDGPSRTIENPETDDEDDEDDGFEINQALLGGLGAFFQ